MTGQNGRVPLTRIARATPQDNTPLSAGSVVTIGAYDGLHLGHQEVLRLVRDLADARGLDAVAVTFDRHPAQVVRPDSAPLSLTTLEQKLELLVGAELLDLVCVLPFDRARSEETASDFVNSVLVGLLGARMVVVGADFHFGHKREGNVSFLERLGADLGFEVLGLGLIAPETDPLHVPYSSTNVRTALVAGDVEGAALLLGRLHEVRGMVVVGDRRGRELGFPTANIALPIDTCLPADGIYAGHFRGSDGDWRNCVISLGRRPTFYEEGAELLLEAYLLDFDGDLYGQEVAVRFLTKIRDQERFESTEALIEAINSDCDQARFALSHP